MISEAQLMNSYSIKNVLGLTIILAATVACSSARTLMPVPNIYQDQTAEQVFADVPEVWHQSQMKISYATDRKPRDNKDGSFGYGSGRSASLAFGTVDIEIKGDPSWDEFAQLSLQSKRSKKLIMQMGEISEKSRLPPTPHPASYVDGKIIFQPEREGEVREVEAMMHAGIEKLLAESARKEVIIYIHGYNNDFSDAAYQLAELWHFLGRKHVPILYTWPAGHEGHSGLRGYNYDRESSEFTIYHLKQFLKSLGTMDEIEKIHLIAHSRGTDVLVSALREIILEIRAEGKNPKNALRIANVILAAPDIDYDVILQRVVAEHSVSGVEHATVYTSPSDKAIRISEWLYGSLARIGHLGSDEFKSSLSEQQMKSIEDNASMKFIEFTGKSDTVGHGYFSSNRAVSSDLITLINTGASPGSAERPLIRKGPVYWVIEDGYPYIESTSD
jgi:esterase/lipase superfamily enzyme